MSFSLSDAFGLKGATGGADDQDPPKDSTEPGADGMPSQSSMMEEVKDPGVYSKGGAGFNPEAMEMAASVATTLGKERNPAANVHAQLTKLNDKKTKMRGKTLEFVDYVAQADKAIRQKMRDENALMRQLKDEHNKVRERFQDELKRQREVDKMKLDRVEREHARRMEEETVQRQDRLRRETIEFEAQLRQKTELERVRAETAGRILAERRNHDLRIEQTRQKAAETRKTVLSGIKLAGETLGKGAAEFLGNREEMTAVVLTLSAAALGIYSARTGTSIMGRYIEARLGRPSLVRETSRRSFREVVRDPFGGVVRLFRTKRYPFENLLQE